MKTITNINAIVITGGPGTGKTSIIKKLSQIGKVCVKESGRHIIKQQLQLGGNYLPWADRQGFGNEMFQMAVKDFEDAANNNLLTFFDRAIPDVIGYLTLCNLPIPDHIWQTAKYYRYHKNIFVTPPWEKIYTNDTERKQRFKEAIDTYKIMLKVYTELHYNVVEIPRVTIAERTDFILDFLRTQH